MGSKIRLPRSHPFRTSEAFCRRPPVRRTDVARNVVLDSGADTHVLPLSYYSEELGTSAYPKLKLVIRDAQGNAIHTTEQKMNITFEFRKENGKKICIMDSAVFGNVTQPPLCSGEIVEVWLGHRAERLTVSVLEERKDNGPNQICEQFHGE